MRDASFLEVLLILTFWVFASSTGIGGLALSYRYRLYGILTSRKRRAESGEWCSNGYKVKSYRKDLVYAQRVCTICRPVKTQRPPLPNKDSTLSSQCHQAPHMCTK